MIDLRTENKLTLLQKCFIYFTCYAMFGWLYETVLEVFIYNWGFSNRGFLFGPYCPIYGFGAIILILLLQNLKEKKIKLGSISITPILVFIGVVVSTTIVELIGSYLMEWTVGDWMWNYNRYWMNFQGRIAPNPSIRFGIGGMFFIYVIQPLLEKLTDKISKKNLNISSIVLGIIFVSDIVYTVFLR